MLKLRLVWFPQRKTIRKGHEERSRWLDLFSMLPHQRYGNSRETGFFENVTQHAHGVSAQGSNGSKENQVDSISFESLSNLRPRLLDNAPRVPERTHERVVVLRYAADGSPLR